MEVNIERMFVNIERMEPASSGWKGTARERK
jgi:hypothetical protein